METRSTHNTSPPFVLPIIMTLGNPTRLIPNVVLKNIFIMVTMIALIFSSLAVSGQNPPNEALWSEGGYSLKKVVSNTSIQSGINFSYTIIFSAPAGASTISIQDQVPSTLQVVSVTAAGPVCSVTPVVNVSGNLVTYNLSALPPSCAPSGSFTIVVKFPEGTTCNGETARNRAEILVNDKWMPTPFVSTTAQAVNPWKVTKTIIAGAVVNPQGGSCGYIMAPGDTVTYRLAVMKDNPYWGNNIGQQNMSSAVVTDVLPAGAVYVPGSNPCVTHPGGTGGTITWNVNCPTQVLDASQPWAYYWTDIKVHYPAGTFPAPTQILNQATLTGVSCLQQYTHTSNQTCITVTPPVPSGTFAKYLSLANRVPGCAGIYFVNFCNNGNVALSPFNINDAIPAGITVNQIVVSGLSATTTGNLNVNNTSFASGLTGYYNSGNITSTVNNIQLQMTGSLPPGGCISIQIYFTVNPNPTGTVITNCANFVPLSNSLNLNPACTSFTVEAGAPKPCIIKDICSPQSSYNPGDIVRFRLRVQNIGSANLTGAAIQDVLHSNFSYVGNETYYTANTFNVACAGGSSIPAGATAWAGVTPSHSGNNLSWNLPNIPSNCQLFYSSYCGYYGTWGIPYYYIEFDAKVDSFALPGVTPNNFQVSGGNLPSAVTSNVVNVLVVASFGQEVHKLISTDGGANFASTGTAIPGSTARFRLNYKNTSNVPVSSVQLIDLLGRDDGTNDWLIFNRSIPRGSQFDVSYTGNHATSLSPAGPAPSPTLSWAAGQNICLPPYVTGFGCNTSTWGAVPDRNIRAQYGTLFNLGPNTNLREDFDVGIPLSALNGQQVCNDFAAIATANFLLNGSPQAVALTPVASPVVCLTIDTTHVSSSCCDSIRIVRAPGADGVIGCCAQMTATCPVDSVKITVSNGTFSAINWNCGPQPTGVAGLTTVSFATSGCIPNIVACVNPAQTGVVSITFTLHMSNGEVCEKRFEMDCTASEPKCCDDVRIEKFSTPDLNEACCARLVTKCETDSIQVSILNGTFSSVNWNCGPIPAGVIGQSSYTFNAGGCAPDLVTCVRPDSTGVVVISYTIFFSNGEKCEKKIEMDCKAPEPKCCDEVRIEKFTDPTQGGDCCARLVTKCEVKTVDVKILNGTFSSVNWNCGPVPAGVIGQSSYSFNANNCALDLVTCVKPDSTGVVVISYVITFANGEKCEKRIVMDCKAPDPEPKCCDEVKIEKFVDPNGTEACCARLVTECKTDSIVVKIQNGTFSSVNWNCGPVPAGVIGQSSYTFNAGGCAPDLVTCVKPDSTGVVVISYMIYFSNGEKCEKRIEMDCKAPDKKCCENVKVEKTENPDGTPSCCAKIVTECEVKTIAVSVTNGVLSNASWNCGPVPSGYAGQSSFTFQSNNCAVNLVTCVTPTQSGTVVINYVITFSNGEVCEKRIVMDCKVPEPDDTCCALANFKLKTKWPFWKTQVGTFNIINADPSVPICYIEITPSPGGTFSTGSLVVDGVTSGQSWNTTRIPATGNLTPSAVNTVDFSLNGTNYSGVVTICVVKCDGTKCCFEFKWNKLVIGDIDISIGETLPTSTLRAVSISPKVTTSSNAKIKYVSFGLSSEEEVAASAAQFFAISAAAHEGDSYPSGLASTITSYMGKNSAFFELSHPKATGEDMGYFNLVFSGKLPKLGCTLFDEEGGILYNGEIKITGSDTVTTSINVNPSASAGNMFELIKVYPNPSSGDFTVTYATGQPRDVEMRIVTSTGITMDTRRLDDRSSGIHNLNVRSGGLAPGMYMIVLISEGETRSKPLIIK